MRQRPRAPGGRALQRRVSRRSGGCHDRHAVGQGWAPRISAAWPPRCRPRPGPAPPDGAPRRPRGAARDTPRPCRVARSGASRRRVVPLRQDRGGGSHCQRGEKSVAAAESSEHEGQEASPDRAHQRARTAQSGRATAQEHGAGELLDGAREARSDVRQRGKACRKDLLQRLAPHSKSERPETIIRLRPPGDEHLMPSRLRRDAQSSSPPCPRPWPCFQPRSSRHAFLAWPGGIQRG